MRGREDFVTFHIDSLRATLREFQSYFFCRGDSW